MARILLIDDDDDLRGVIAQNLSIAGHTVIQAADGHIGLKLFQTTPVDLVLTDLIMPNTEGIETIVEIHRAQPNLPIIAMSGGIPRSTMYLGIAAKLGARCALSKPFTAEELHAAINQALTEAPPKPTDA